MRAPVRPGRAPVARKNAVSEKSSTGAGRAVEQPAPGRLHQVSAQFGQRMAERRRAIRRLRWRTVAITIGIVAGLCAGVYLVAFSSVLALRAEHIEITGASDVVDRQAVLEPAQAHDGSPLVRVDTTGLAHRIESEVTGVLSAEVTRSWPHGLTIALTPRVPVATVAQDEGYVVLDSEAVALEVTEDPRPDVPLVEVDLSREGSAGALEAVVTVLGSLPPELFEEVSSAGARSADRVELELADGSSVIWGSAEENELKAQVLATLRQVPAAVYDVAAPRNPITRDV